MFFVKAICKSLLACELLGRSWPLPPFTKELHIFTVFQDVVWIVPQSTKELHVHMALHSVVSIGQKAGRLHQLRTWEFQIKQESRLKASKATFTTSFIFQAAGGLTTVPLATALLLWNVLFYRSNFSIGSLFMFFLCVCLCLHFLYLRRYLNTKL